MSSGKQSNTIAVLRNQRVPAFISRFSMSSTVSLTNISLIIVFDREVSDVYLITINKNRPHRGTVELPFGGEGVRL